MEARVTWTGHKMHLIGTNNRGHQIDLDTKPPFGDDKYISPKELLLQGLCGCTAMDVIALMRKYKQNMTQFEVKARTELTTEHPMVFQDIELEYHLQGTDLDVSKVKEAVELSRNKYCGVSAMLEKNSPIRHSIFINGEKVE